jgi:hypothetical protein
VYPSYDISIEFFETSRWNPVFSVTRISGRVYFEVAQVRREHIKPEHVSYEP